MSLSRCLILTKHLPDDRQLAEAKRAFQLQLIAVLLGLFAIWSVKIVETFWGLSLYQWGMYPRTLKGLLGIATMPFLHADFQHLYSNSFALLVLGLGLFHFYERVAKRVLAYSTILAGGLVWLLARPVYHIGASGIVYSLSAFLFLSGVLRRDRRSMGAALVVALLYGGAVWGVLPFYPQISWEGHLFGAVAGCYLALIYRNVDRPLSEAWAEDETDEYGMELNETSHEDPHRREPYSALVKGGDNP